MAANSSKPAKTGNSQVLALQVVQEWLRREGGRSKIPTALGALVEATTTAVARGDDPPEKDGASLVEVWRQAQHDPGISATIPRGPEFEKWWSARASHIRQACLDRQCRWLPQLEIKPGGGRGLPTLYALELIPLSPGDGDEDSSEHGHPSIPADGLRYRVDPVKPALWLRLLVGTRPFPIHSWRGYVLIGSAVLNFVLIGLIWWTIIVHWLPARPITTADLSLIALASLISVSLWHLTRPIRQLPSRRVVLANESLLSLSTLHGQLRTMRENRTKLQGRVFSVVRHWGTCPLCAAEVDLADGGKAFPDRIIGRCGDAPLEHVFSFDPVRLAGSSLRAER